MCHVTIPVIGIKLENGVVFWSIDKMNNVVKLITLTSFVCFRWCLLFPYSYLEPNITDFIYECGLNINFEEGKPMLPIVLSLCISSMVLGLIGKAAYMAHRTISTASPMTTEQIWGAHFTNDFSIVTENSMENRLCYNLFPSNHIAATFCTCYNSTPGVMGKTLWQSHC